MAIIGRKRKRSSADNDLPFPQSRHPYLTGNFAPIQQTLPLTPCTYTGRIPEELADSEYVRNGSNPVSNEDLGRDAHWFDGDGMLSGVLFSKDETTGDISPAFVNQFVLTDLYLSTRSSPRLGVPILPSIATLVSPLASIFWVTLRILRTVMLVILSHLPGSKQPIKKISVANTNVIYHDGRALALCESGPPMRIQLPGLETVGWYNGTSSEGEPVQQIPTDNKPGVLGENGGLISFMREWTTAHPKVDPVTNDMLMFHSSFAPPYVQYSIIPHATTSVSQPEKHAFPQQTKLLNAAVPGVSSAKMMHDFGVSLTHTVIMDLPLTLDPLNQLHGLPPVSFNSSKPSRFGVFPRRQPEQVRWFETDASCIFHTANTWDRFNSLGNPIAINMLACRLTSATTIYAAGNLLPPVEKAGKLRAKPRRWMPSFFKPKREAGVARYESSSQLEFHPNEAEPLLRSNNPKLEAGSSEACTQDQCRLYYYEFDLDRGSIAHQWALSAIPFEFPSVRPNREMQEARYIYGCSTTTTSFGSALGKATKIDALVKIDAARLIARGRSNPPRSVTGIVDTRNMTEILGSPKSDDDPIQVFRMPNGWFAQEPRFVPASSSLSEDDGYLLFYAFDESQLTPSGDVPLDTVPSLRAKSELWVVNARNMQDLVARVHLPQRVPYGLHGSWFSPEQIRDQRPVESIRSTARAMEEKGKGLWMYIRDCIEKFLG